MLAALSQLLIFNSVNLTREMGSIFLLLPLVWMLQRTPPDSADAWKRMLVIGMLFGCIAFIDPVFLVVAAVVLVVYGLNNRVPLRQRVRLIGVLLIALYLTLMPLKLFVNTPTNWSELLSPVSRPKVFAIHLSRDWSSPATELFERGINVFAFPVDSVVNVIREPRVASALIAEKSGLIFDVLFSRDTPVIFHHSCLSPTHSSAQI